MKWLEIIEFNSEEINTEFIEKDIESLIEKLKKGNDPKIIKVYSRVSAEIDFSIHMHQRTNSITKRGSSLGKSLSSILREFGTIKHNVWV
ncbi:MAG: hypothetical protein GY936_10890 [Ignavibacteriae bacterium]|nr:hypothetical protein [Ignavibacteriota bacterium]